MCCCTLVAGSPELIVLNSLGIQKLPKAGERNEPVFSVQCKLCLNLYSEIQEAGSSEW